MDHVKKIERFNLSIGNMFKFMAMNFATLSNTLFRSKNHSLKQVGFCNSHYTGDTESQAYRYSFQGQEADHEIKDIGNSINYKYRMHDPRLGRFFAVDPLAPKYPHNSPYAFSENRVIDGVELEGLEVVPANEIWNLSNKQTTVTQKNNVDYYGEFKVAQIHGRQVTLFEINSGPNKGNYLGIVHYGGSYNNFDPGALRGRTPPENYRWEELYVVGSKRAPKGAFSGEIPDERSVDNLIDAMDSKKEYSYALSVVHLSNTYGEGFYSPETGLWVDTDTPSKQFERVGNYLLHEWTDPTNFLPGPEIKLKVKYSPSFRNYNNFQKQTKGIFNKANYGNDFLKNKVAEYDKWLNQELSMPIEKPEEDEKNEK